ncbi:flagellar transcriptional regulator FlhD [Variovorax sp. KK3]|uniref:flagellar transcriptional regulator FlhD n=1 Tax=Variovorax sp. KK3 TaxID=1855728 RepID=UPI00097C975C|nr:flagellar transcriptional regulator FlhD [Variovorax sp. KK3]
METEKLNNAAAGGDISKEIGDINLAYMLLAQKLVKQDRAAAMFKLGVSSELADMLANMSLGQILKLATSNFLLCSFRIDDHPSMSAVVGEAKDPTLQLAHMSILMSARRLQMLA